MAAAVIGCEAPVRLRLFFDYPPPRSPACGLCWLLLEPSHVRLVTDLISLIRDKFGFSRRAKLSLFLDGALLPPTESARLVRDNDSLRVRLEEVTGGDSYEKTANGFTRLSKKERKRHRQKLEAEESSSEDEEYRKRKKSKWTIEHLSSQEENTTNIQELKKLKKKEKVVTERNCVADNTIDDNTSPSKKLKKRADQEKEQEAERVQKKQKARTLDTKTAKPFPVSPNPKCTAKNTRLQSNPKIGETSNESSTSSSDSDHSTAESLKQKVSNKTKVAALHTHKSQLESPEKSTPVGKLATEPKNRSSCNIPNINKPEIPSSSSGKLILVQEQQNSNLKKKLPSNNPGTGTRLISKTKPYSSSSESDSSESDTCTVKKPKTNTAQPLVGNGNNPGTGTKLISKTKPYSSSSESDSSESDTCTVKKPKTNTAQPLVGNGNNPGTGIKLISKTKPYSSSSESDSSESDTCTVKKPKTNTAQPLVGNSNNPGTGTKLTSKTKPNSSSSESDSSESDTCTVKKPKTNTAQPLVGNGGKLPNDTCGPTTSHSNPGRGRGRGGENAFWRGPRVRGCRGMVRGRGRGRGEGTNFYHYNDERQKQQQLNETATNSSVIIQNSPEAPKKDYSTLPLLAAPPQVGERIAFKLLELTENYSPEVSDYKEGKIVNWNPTNKQLELEMLSFSSVAKEPGKFDLVYQSADGAETIEYAVSQERKITETWDALIEPRLIVDPPNIATNTENVNL